MTFASPLVLLVLLLVPVAIALGGDPAIAVPMVTVFVLLTAVPALGRRMPPILGAQPAELLACILRRRRRGCCPQPAAGVHDDGLASDWVPIDALKEGHRLLAGVCANRLGRAAPGGAG